MATFNKAKLTGPSQGITGTRTWYYTDTGVRVADVAEVAGFFTTGYDCGMRVGDFVILTEGDTGSGAALNNRGRIHGMAILSAQDTGSTQVTCGAAVVIGDTS